MALLTSSCTKCDTQFSWNSSYQEAPLCPNCGYDTIYSGKRNKEGTISITDSATTWGAIAWPLNLFFKPKWRNPKPDVRLQAIYKTQDEGILAHIAATDIDKDVRAVAQELLQIFDEDDKKSEAVPMCEGDLCDAKEVVVFLGLNCRRTKYLLKHLRVGSGVLICAPSLAALRKVFPDGRCGKCKNYHSYQWTVTYSFFIPNCRGKRTTRENMESFINRFASVLSRVDKRKVHFVPGLDWRGNVADSSGSFTYTGQANTQWIGWSFEPIQVAYETICQTIKKPDCLSSNTNAVNNITTEKSTPTTKINNKVRKELNVETNDIQRNDPNLKSKKNETIVPPDKILLRDKPSIIEKESILKPNKITNFEDKQQLFYQVLFDGKISVGRNLDKVKKQLTSLFKADAKAIDTLFSGRTVIVKNRIDRQTAQKYKDTFKKAGAICTIRPIEQLSETTQVVNKSKSIST